MEKVTMTKDGATKFVIREDIKELLLAQGWVVEGEEAVEVGAPRRGRKPRGEATEE